GAPGPSLPVAEQPLALLLEKTAGDGDGVIALLEDEPAGDETGPPLVFVRAPLPPEGGDVFLGHAVDDRADSRPHAGAGAHGAGFVGGVENEVGQVAAVTARDVLESLQLDVLDAGSRRLDPVPGAGNDHLAPVRETCDDSANRIVAAVAGALGLGDRQLHELLLRFVGSRNNGNQNTQISSQPPGTDRGEWLRKAAAPVFPGGRRIPMKASRRAALRAPVAAAVLAAVFAGGAAAPGPTRTPAALDRAALTSQVRE